VQRILKEHGIKSVQSLADSNNAVSFGAIEEAVGQSLLEDGKEDPGADVEDEGEDEEYAGGDAPPAWELTARGRSRSEGCAAGSVQASYLHVHWAAHPHLAARFVAAAA